MQNKVETPKVDFQNCAVFKSGETCESLLNLQQLSVIMDASPVPCFVIDASHRVSFWNKGCEQILGIPAEKMTGTNEQWKAFYEMPRATLADLIVDQVAGEALGSALYKSKKLRRSTLIPDAFEAEDFFPALGHEGRWLFFTAAPVRDENGQIIGAVETLQDITTQRKAEIALLKSHEELEKRVAERTAELAESNRQLAVSLSKSEEINRLKSAFLATVSHELNTPLNGIIGFSDLIMMDHPDDSDGEFARQINQSGKKLYKLLKSMLALTEIEAGEAEVTTHPCSTKELLDGLLQEFSRFAGEKDVILSSDFCKNTEEVIYSDPQRLRESIGILIDNAIRYMDKHGGWVEVSASSNAGHFTVTVTDNGPGIPAGSEKTIFEKFRQLESFETRHHDGMGLGLALARAQAELLDGELTLQAPVGGQGARFVLSIPAKA